MAFRYAVVNKTRDIANIGTTELVDKAMVLDKEKGTWLLGFTGGKKTDIIGSHLFIRDEQGNELYEHGGKQTYRPAEGSPYQDAPIAMAGKRRYVWFNKIVPADGLCVKASFPFDYWTTMKGDDAYGSVEQEGGHLVVKGNTSDQAGPFIDGGSFALKDDKPIYDTLQIYLDPDAYANGDVFRIAWHCNNKQGVHFVEAQMHAVKNDDGIAVDYVQDEKQETRFDYTITEAGWYTFVFAFENWHEPIFETAPVGKIIGYDVDTINEIVAMLPKDETLFVVSLAEDQPVKDEEEPTEPTEPSDPDEVDPEPEVPGTGDGEEEAAEG